MTTTDGKGGLTPEREDRAEEVFRWMEEVKHVDRFNLKQAWKDGWITTGELVRRAHAPYRER